MNEEKIKSELSLLTTQCPAHVRSLTVDQLRQLQNTSNNIVKNILDTIQQTTLPEMIQLSNRLEDFEEIFPEEISLLRLWLVGGEKLPGETNGIQQESIKIVIQMIQKIQTIDFSTLSREKMVEILSLAQETSYLLSFLTQYEEQADRIQKFENFVKTLNLEDRKILTQMLKSKTDSMMSYSS